ncbi:LGFP repeat-containing protein, partial [Lentzea aerocolonigenes]|uniref:LGFP repeat-containing protein n=1 Tax=Lentzea aerocolonigenes TaxID=68170 RepID=UPI000B19D3C6
MRWIRLTIAVAMALAGVVAVVPAAPASAATAAPTRCGAFAVDVPIAKRWAALRGERGVLGCPTANAVDVPNPRGKLQTFENGEIAFSPTHGQDMVIAVYRRGAEVTVDWAQMDGPEHPSWVVRWSYNGIAVGEQGVSFKHPREGIFTTTVAQGAGRYEFTVEGYDNQTHSDRGQTVAVGITIPDYHEKPSNCFVAVGTALLQNWHEFGGRDGRLSCPVDSAVETNLAPGVRGVRQPFENGVLTRVLDATQPGVISAVAAGNDVLVQWGRKNTKYRGFLVKVTDGTIKGEYYTPVDTLHGGLRSEGSLVVPGSGDFSVSVYGCGLSTPGLPPPGCTTYVASTWALIRPTWNTELDKATTADPEQSLLTLDRRRAAAVQHYACSHMVEANGPSYGDMFDLYNGWRAGEDLGALLTAHLEMVRIKGPDFTCPRQKPSLDYVNEVLRNIMPHDVGTSWDRVEFGPFNCDARFGDFDSFQKSLPAVMFRYRDLLRPETFWHVMDRLMYVRGPADDFNEKRELCRGIIIPESENHRLMIETTKYLANDLWLPVGNDQRYNNATNGQRDYILRMLHEFAKHDFMEYNARVYTRYSLHALMNLYDYARDPLVRDAARAILDYSTTKFSLSSNGLRRAGPFRRTTNNTDENNKTWFKGGSDPLTAFFLMWTGYRPSDQDWQQSPWLVEPDEQGKGGWRARDLIPEWYSVESVIVSTTRYLPPRTAIRKAMVRDATFQASFYHGEGRPKVPFSPDFASPGVEIYSQSPSFQLSAGGAWLNSGYGNDEIYEKMGKNENYGAPQSTTLMPTRNLPNTGPNNEIGQAVVRNNLIRFDGTQMGDKPDKRGMVNTCVDGGFACGTNFVVPEMYKACGDKVERERWLFLDLDTAKCGKLGFVVALRFSDHDGKRDGFLYAVEKAKVPNLAGWADKIVADNAFQPAVFGMGEFHVFKSPDNGSYVFTVLRKAQDMVHQPMIIQAGERKIEDLRFNGLARSPWLYSDMNNGYLEIRNPDCDSRTVYDFRAALSPQSKTYEWGRCDTAAASRLVTEATALWSQGKRDEAVAKSVQAVGIWREYAAENPASAPGLYEYIRSTVATYLQQTG